MRCCSSARSPSSPVVPADSVDSRQHPHVSTNSFGLALAEGCSGVALLLGSGPLLRSLAGSAADRRVVNTARVLGARQLLQGLFTAWWPTRRTMVVGAAVDTIHAATMVAAAAANLGPRRLTIASAATATTFAAAGFAIGSDDNECRGRPRRSAARPASRRFQICSQIARQVATLSPDLRTSRGPSVTAGLLLGREAVGISGSGSVWPVPGRILRRPLAQGGARPLASLPCAAAASSSHSVPVTPAEAVADSSCLRKLAWTGPILAVWQL
jgi:hypothetical protein